MDPARFRDSPAGRLVRVGQAEAAYHAFVPAPLPPSLPLDADLWRALSAADRALGELAGLGRTLLNPHLLIQPFIRREAVLSSRIEGTRTTLAGLYAFEAGQLDLLGLPADALDHDAREVFNYVRALEYGLERLATLPLSGRFIRELHARLLEGVRGGYATPGESRTNQNWIGRPGSTLNSATYVPPPAASGELADCLAAFERYLHAEDEYPPLVRLAFIHYQFEAIHPFGDGNGRLGRLLLTILLADWGLLPQPLLYLSAFFEDHRQDYYDLLLRVSERGDWSAWVLFFLSGVTEQARDAADRVKRLQDLQREWRERLAGVQGSGSLLRLVDELIATPLLTVGQAQRALGVTYRTAGLSVRKLVDAGVLRPLDERAYGRRFVADRVLEIISA